MVARLGSILLSLFFGLTFVVVDAAENGGGIGEPCAGHDGRGCVPPPSTDDDSQNGTMSYFVGEDGKEYMVFTGENGEQYVVPLESSAAGAELN